MLSTAFAIVLAAAAPQSDRTARELPVALERFRVAWLAGRLELNETARERGRTHAVWGHHVLHPRDPATLTHEEALCLATEAAVAHQTPEVTRGLLRLAAIGLSPEPRVAAERRPSAVREPARAALGCFREPACIDVLMCVARGADAGWRGRLELPHRSAALIALGMVEHDVVRPAIEAQLADPEPEVRRAAADALQRRANPRSVEALTRRLLVEEDADVARVLVPALYAALNADPAAVDTVVARRAVAAALDATGRFDWRVDLAIVELCASFRTASAIPVLIGMLERQLQSRDPRLKSGILRHRAHAVLQDLTGARFPAEAPGEWRAFWERERDGFRLAAPRPQRTEAGRTTSGFFGVPVLGSRVVFVIDTSGSMAAVYQPLPSHAGTSDRVSTPDAATRLDWAKHELRRAVAGLPPDTLFNVVRFASRAEPWRDELTPPEPGVKKSLDATLAKLEANGGTNVFDALLLALENDAVDEIFLLSDGQPSSGRLTDPAAIVDVVTERNRFRWVRIHTIYMGGGDSEFMAALAERNNGRYVRL